MKDPKKKSDNKGHLFQKSDGPTVRDLREQARKLGLPFKEYWHLKKAALVELLEGLKNKGKKAASKPRTATASSPAPAPAPVSAKAPAEAKATAKSSAKATKGGKTGKADKAAGADRPLGRLDVGVENLEDPSATSRVPLTPPPTGFREPLEPHEVYIDRGLPLPQTYGQDRITILPRDPHYLFIFWELDGDRAREGRQRGGEWVLRLETLTRNTSFDIYVGGAMCWYLKVTEGEDYRARIGVKLGDGQFFEIACSDVRTMPVSELSADLSETWAVVVRDARKLHRTRAVPYVIAHRDAPGSGWQYPLGHEQRMLQDAELEEIRMPGGDGSTIIRRKWRVPLGRYAYETPPEALGSSAMIRYRGEWKAEDSGEEIDVIHVLKQGKPALDVPSSFSGTLQPRPMS